MTVQNMWPLVFLILVPVVILLYLLKQKVKDESFSSIILWQEIYKNLEAKTPFEKLKQNILMYLQILLILLLIFALMAPVLKKGGAVQENCVIVMDESASMQYLYRDEESRLEQSIRLAKKEVDALSEDAQVTLVSSGAEAAVVYQGQDKTTVKKRLDEIEPTLETGTLDQAAGLVNSLIADMENVQIICYTDSAFDSEAFLKNNTKAALIVEDMYSEGENCSLDYINYSVKDDEVEVLCKVTNHGQLEVTQDVSLYVNQQIADVQNVTIKPQESETVYFNPQKMETDGSAVVKAELSRKDALTSDNMQSMAVVAAAEKRVLLLSEGNVFLEKALSVNDGVTVYKSDSIGVLNQEEDTYDLYVFDQMVLPEDYETGKFPEHASYLFLGYEQAFGEAGYLVKESVQENVVLTFADTPVTQYMKDYSFGVTKTNLYEVPEWAVPFLKTEKGEIAGYYGTENGHNIAVLGFDIHNTDFPLQVEFPIFVSQLCDSLMGTKADIQEITNFPVAEESDVVPVDGVTKDGTKNNKKTGGRAVRNLILMLVILLFAMEWIIYAKQVNSNKKKQFLVVRGLVILTVILAMAGISVTKKQKKSETIFLVDVSESMSGNLAEIQQYLKKTLEEMPEKNLYGIVAFGKDTAVEQFLSDERVFSEFTSNPVTTATNIEKAVQKAGSMFDEGVSKRLVLITDGMENEGNMSLAASKLKGNEVELYTIAMEDCIGSDSEVYIANLLAPAVIHVGDHYNVTVEVESNVETDAILSLYAGRSLKGQQEVHITKGENQFVFEDTGTEGTIARYKATIETTEDTVAANNTYVTFADIEAKPKVLLIEGKSGEGEEFEKVLTAANIDYDKVTPKGVPVTVSELNQYKAVITLDVHYDDLRNGFAKSLESYVKDFAGGYICIGGDNSYALGNYRDTELEEILPVKMDLEGEKEIPKIAMAMVIDQSGSMSDTSSESSSVTGLDLAKQAAMAAVTELRSNDDAGVLAFDDQYSWIVPMTQVNDPKAMKEAIEAIDYGGGTSIYPAVREAYSKIITSDAQIKHIILLTDGQDSFHQYEDLINKINESNVTVSTVAVGKDSDTATLSMIAKKCGGRAYYTDINNSIPRIFAQEVYLSTNTYLINEEFYPTVVSSSTILDGVLEEGCPALYGYIAATPKQTAQVVLESEKGDPLLTTWQYGLGRTVAWNSDGINEWTAEFASWENYPMLWSNIIHYVISDTGFGEDNLEVVKEGNTAVITYETKNYDKATTVTAVITDEQANATEVKLQAVKPGVFEAEFAPGDVGVYSINVRKMDGSQVVQNYNTAYANQYSAEYQFGSDTKDLNTFVKQAGGKMITLQDNIWQKAQNAVKIRKSLTVPLLILTMFLFLFDIMIRRFSIDVWSYILLVWKKLTGCFEKLFHKTVKPKEQRQQKNSGKTQQMQAENSEAQIVAKKAKTKPVVKNKPKEQNETLDMNQLLKKKRERE